MKTSLPYGLYYDASFIQPHERTQILEYLLALHPIWEMRYTEQSAKKAPSGQRRLLRPVYWLGNWQFACLNYYKPPERTKHVCVQAESYPPVLARLVEKAEKITKQTFKRSDIPSAWHLNTCLINYYGDQNVDGKWIDCARVGEHKDFEPGPVASMSFGERAFFQFVRSYRKDVRSMPVFQQWLEDSSLQIFGGKKWKEDTFHRVQRVERKRNETFPLPVEAFETRRINLTFRFVPDADIVPYYQLPHSVQKAVLPYMTELASHSPFFAAALKKEPKQRI